MPNAKPSGPRSVAIVGPYLSGKTSLLESILHICGATHRKGRVADGTSFGDASAEARERKMTIEPNVAVARYLDSEFTFIDCPGSIEFQQATLDALVGVDAAIVVCEPDPDRVLALSPLLHFLDEQKIPRFIFVNKIDKARGPVRDLLQALQPVSLRPLVLRQVPIRGPAEGGVNGPVIGYVDLATERAYIYHDNEASEIVPMPDGVKGREAEARTEMLERLADFDDALMEQLLADETPTRDAVFADLQRDLRDGLIVPVLFGAAETDHGVRRLLKALRHEVPAQDEAAMRAGVDATEPAFCGQVLKTVMTPHGGKLSLTRIWSGRIADGTVVNGERVAGIYKGVSANAPKVAEAQAGEIVALGRLDHVHTGDTLREGKGGGDACPRAPRLPPAYGLAIRAARRDDDVKLSAAIAKLTEEDPSLYLETDAQAQQLVLWGQGDIHLKVALSQLKNRLGLTVETTPPRVPYRETIKRAVSQHARHKRQSGGHGQFGDVHLYIAPLPRGSGFAFESRIIGGTVPKQYVPAVEEGIKEFCQRGPLGFPVVDLAVALTDGSYHAVDSSEMAFKTAARMGMTEGLPKGEPTLLEPIHKVDIAVPSEFTPKANALIGGRRGQILGFDSREGWPGWDVVSAYMPRTEMHDLILELRSLTQGVGQFNHEFDHLQELAGRHADQIITQRRAELDR